jgi:hypothetical protein
MEIQMRKQMKKLDKRIIGLAIIGGVVLYWYRNKENAFFGTMQTM